MMEDLEGFSEVSIENSEIEKRGDPENKRRFWIICSLIFILLLFLFAPIPRRQDAVYCLSCLPNDSTCLPCPKEGDVYWNPPLVFQYIEKIRYKNPEEHFTKSITPSPTTLPTQSADETSTWKTLTSEKFGVSFQYPPNFNFEPQTEFEDGLYLVFRDKNSEGMPPLTINALTGEDARKYKVDLDKVLVTKKSVDGYYEISEISVKKIDNQTFYFYLESVDPNGFGPQKLPIPGNPNYQFIAGGMVKDMFFDFAYITGHDTLNKDRNTFNNILSTLKFSNPKTIDISNWNTYANSEYSFTLKYPNTWSSSKSVKDSNSLTSFSPPGADIFANTEQDTPGSGIKPQVLIEIVNEPFAEPDKKFISNFRYIYIKGKEVYGHYYLKLSAPISPYIFDLPYDNKRKILRLTLIYHGQENIDRFNKEHNANVKDTDEITFKTMISTFKFNTPTPGCTPRPACLDATPRCLLPEPAAGWCK